MVKRLFLCTCLLFAIQGFAIADITEGFDISPPPGWVIVNNSSPGGLTSWFQGNPGIFGAQSGAPDSYIAANFVNADVGGNISDWLLTPVFSISNGDVMSFYTRSAGAFPDRLEVRLSTNGSSTDVGASDTSVGDFSELLLTINPTLDPTGYPDAWTHFSVTMGGLGSGVTGRYAFRYFVPDTNTNGDYIGIDTFNLVPEPTSILTLGTVLTALALLRRKAFRR